MANMQGHTCPPLWTITGDFEGRAHGYSAKQAVAKLIEDQIDAFPEERPRGPWNLECRRMDYQKAKPRVRVEQLVVTPKVQVILEFEEIARGLELPSKEKTP